ncbi:MAG: hypothetical protein SGPRY_014675, partial [Prymnesium sp.]
MRPGFLCLLLASSAAEETKCEPCHMHAPRLPLALTSLQRSARHPLPRPLLLSTSPRSPLPSPPRFSPLVALLAQCKLLLLVILRLLLIDDLARGKDQRRPWVLALAELHPSLRLSILALALLLASTPYLLRSWASDPRCIPLSPLCRPLLQASLAILTLSLLLGSLYSASRLAAAEEAKDGELSEEWIAAACAAAVYQSDPLSRLAELRARGVESRNWKVDERLSTETVCTFYNWYSQSVWVAFRGTWSLEDWASNIASIVPGQEMKDALFQANLKVAQAAQRKYLLFKSIRLTGHSRGGNMADLFGRKLGLRSIAINPATWGKLLKESEVCGCFTMTKSLPSVESITARTADIISVLESFAIQDRQ